MTKQLRNTTKIVQLAKEKSDRTKVKVEKVISKMSLEGKTINFNTVSKEANVSKSWLYKVNDVRTRIESLRNQQQKKLKNGKKATKNNRSEDTLIRTLKDRIKDLEEEKRILKKQIEKLYGELYQSS